ncbi:MAG TPA: hypothetical protein VLS96_18230 [Nodosilinea sp.]|nr:hypothetical protein [Nodosilinea sp.]
MASDRAVGWSGRLPAPLRQWTDSALVTRQHKEFSIRYIGFAILSSVAVGIGTAEIMRSQQVRSQRRQGLLDQALTETGDERPLTPTLEVDPTVGVLAETKSGESAASALDWATLVQPRAEQEPPLTEGGLLSTPMGSHPIYHIHGADQSRSLALQMEGDYYRFYRQRPSLEKARQLVQRLQQQGQKAVVTSDDGGYVVWIHPAEPPAEAQPWLGLGMAG